MCDTIRFKKKPKTRYYILRQYSAVANKTHDCDRCCLPIYPGDSYAARVIVLGRKIRVEKYHTPECPEDPIDDEAKREENWFANLAERRGRNKVSIVGRVA